MEHDGEGILKASNTDFEAGNVIRKFMAFISHIHTCSKDMQQYLVEICTTNGCQRWEIRLWVWTCWGSLSDCLAVTLSIQKVWPNIMCAMY